MTRGKGGTYIPFPNANGEMIMAVFIIPTDKNGNANFELRELERRKRGQHQTFYWFTETGYNNSDMWLAILKKFKTEFQILYPGLEPMILADNLGSHETDEILEWAVLNKVHLVFFPANATHFLQPADDKLFGLFKKILETLLQARLVTVTHNNRDLGSFLIGAAQEAQKAITKR